MTGEQCEHIHHLSALTALTSLCLHTSHETMGLPLPALQQLLAGGRLRQLSLLGQCGFEQHLPLSALSGLESLALDIAEIQACVGAAMSLPLAPAADMGSWPELAPQQLPHFQRRRCMPYALESCKHAIAYVHNCPSVCSWSPGACPASLG